MPEEIVVPATTQQPTIPVIPPPGTNGVTPPAEVVTPPEPEGEKPKTPEDQRYAARFSALSRREKAAVEQEKQARTLLESAKAEQAKMQPLLDALGQKDVNPQALLDAAGITMDQLIRWHVNNGKPAEEDKIAQLEKRIENKEAADKAAREAEERSRLAAQEAHVTRLIDGYRKETNEHIAANPDEYELILAGDAQDEVFSLIVEHYAEHGTILSPDQAAKQVEEHLYQEGLKLLGVKKFAKKAETQKEEKAQPAQTFQRPKTLSNTQVVSDPVSKINRPTTQEERLKAAAAKLQYLDDKK